VRRTPEEQSLDRLRANRWGELVEELADDETFVTRAMFGCVACYLHGLLKLVLADGDSPWDGVLVPTAREHHAALRATLPALRVHPVLGKWLYLAAEDDGFEDDVRALVALARAGDPRVGVEPGTRRRKSTRRVHRKTATRRRRAGAT
jgi:hypothetical protein